MSRSRGLQAFKRGGSDFTKRLTDNIANRIWLLWHANVVHIYCERQMLSSLRGGIAGQSFTRYHHITIQQIRISVSSSFCKNISGCGRIHLNLEKCAVAAEYWKRVVK